MSETNQQEGPNEPLVIKSDHPHTVTMSEGSNIAAGKKGEVGTPMVRKVLADHDENVVEHIVMDGGVSKSSEPSKDIIAKGDVFSGQHNVADAPDRFISQPKELQVPPPLAKNMSAPELGRSAMAKAAVVGADTLDRASGKAAQISATGAAQSVQIPEMDFPARVIKVKMENDLVRARLDLLEE
jgi:hypothetical protein